MALPARTGLQTTSTCGPVTRAVALLPLLFQNTSTQHGVGNKAAALAFLLLAWASAVAYIGNLRRAIALNVLPTIVGAIHTRKPFVGHHRARRRPVFHGVAVVCVCLWCVCVCGGLRKVGHTGRGEHGRSRYSRTGAARTLQCREQEPVRQPALAMRTWRAAGSMRVHTRGGGGGGAYA